MYSVGVDQYLYFMAECNRILEITANGLAAFAVIATRYFYNYERKK